jgi:hypothetical protein
MPPPTPLPFPCTDRVASEKLHDDAARVEQVVKSSNTADGITEGKRMLVVFSKKQVDASKFESVRFAGGHFSSRTSEKRKLSLFGCVLVHSGNRVFCLSIRVTSSSQEDLLFAIPIRNQGSILKSYSRFRSGELCFQIYATAVGEG